jgi:hypothetical protein
MVGHYDPCQQAVTLGVEEQERILHHAGGGWCAEHARAVARVYPRVRFLAAFGIALSRGEERYLFFHLLQRLFGHAIR